MIQYNIVVRVAVDLPSARGLVKLETVNKMSEETTAV